MSVASRAERILLPATFVTNLGSSIQLTAAALLLVRNERSTLAVGWLFIAIAIPQVLLSIGFGRLADRLDRRALCVICDVLSFFAAILLPISLALGAQASVTAYLSNFALAATYAMFLPASSALIKERVRPARLPQFNANFEIATQAGTLLSSAIGGFVIQLAGTSFVFIFNALTFVMSAVLLMAIGPLRRPAPSTSSPVTTDGDHVTGEPAQPVIWLGLLYAIGNVVITVSNTLLVVLVVQVFDRGAGVLGVVDGLAGLGVLLAATLYKRLRARVSDLPIALLGYLGCALMIFLQPRYGMGPLLALFPIGALSFGMARIAARTLLLGAVSERRVGRIFGATNSFGLAFSVASTLVITRVADRVDIRMGYLLLAAIISVTALLATGLILRDLRVKQAAT